MDEAPYSDENDIELDNPCFCKESVPDWRTILMYNYVIGRMINIFMLLLL